MENDKTLKTDSSNHIPSFENISTQSSDFESLGSMKSPMNKKMKFISKNQALVEWKRTLSASEDSFGEEEFQSEILRRNTRKQLFRPGTHSNLAIKPIENVERKNKEKTPEAIQTIKLALQNHFVFKSLDKEAM
jgi:hypothetical protein